MSTDTHYDFIIIGTGAGGGTLAWKLAPSGKRILVIERGGYVPREKDNWNSKAVNAEGKYNTMETWRDVDGKPMHPHTNYYVGGNTKFYGAALFRLRAEDFGEIQHHGGISPVERRGESRPHDHGERTPRRRASAEADRRDDGDGGGMTKEPRPLSTHRHTAITVAPCLHVLLFRIHRTLTHDQTHLSHYHPRRHEHPRCSQPVPFPQSFHEYEYRHLTRHCPLAR